MRCVCLALALSACGQKANAVATNFPDAALLTTPSADGTLTIALRTAPTQPPARGIFTGQFEVTDQNGAPVTGLTIEVTPWMPDMGHGSTLPTVSEVGDGKYLLEEVNLFMPGLWELRTTITGKATTTADPQLQMP
jgi:hypothetical protein